MTFKSRGIQEHSSLAVHTMLWITGTGVSASSGTREALSSEVYVRLRIFIK